MPSVDETIRELVTSKKVVLFMKGSRQFPQCGFSAQVVEILNKLVPSYDTVNVLSDPALREGIKRFSDWPTIPQLYVDGKFIGGCDIVKEMFSSGELAEALGVKGARLPEASEQRATPAIRVSPAARAALEGARESQTEDLRVVVSPTFEHELYFDGAQPADVVVEAGGVTLRLDAASAGRANGLTIDYVDGSAGAPGGAGFKIENPNAPPRSAAVRSLTPRGLRDALDAKTPLVLFDVRTDDERATAMVKEAVALDDDGRKKLASLDRASKLVFMCHHGMRSRVAAEAALRQGFTDVWNLEGGIDAWSKEVDPSVPRY